MLSLFPNAKKHIQTTSFRDTTRRRCSGLRLMSLIPCLVATLGFGVGSAFASVDARVDGAPMSSAVIGVAKNATINGTQIMFDFYLENFSTSYLNGLALTENLDVVFGIGGYTIVSPPAFIDDPGTITLNSSFDGSSDLEIFTSGSGLPVGETAQVRLMVTVTTVTDVGFGCGVYSNQVTVSAEGGTISDLSDSGTDPDPNGNGNPTEAGENDPTVFTVAVPIADLSITKTDGVTTGVPGQSVTYTITASNAGPSNVTGAGFNDILPSAITSATWTSFSSGGASGNTASGSGNINEVLNLPAGASVTYTVPANIAPSATGSLVNTATVTAPVCVTDPTPGNNTATDFDNLLPLADLSMLVGDSADPVSAGAGFSYSLDVSNNGPSMATSITVTDNLPAGVGVVNASGTGWSCGVSGSTVTCTRSSLGIGAAPTITISVTAPVAAGNITNTASVSAGVIDINLGNNSDTESTAIAVPPGFAMAFSPDIIGSGGVSTLTFTIDNTANSLAATSLSFVDNLPAAVTIASPLNVSSTCPGATLTAVPGTSLISYGSSGVAGGASCTLQIDVTSSTTGIHLNTTGDLTSSLGNSGTASNSLIVEPPPTFAKAFSPDQIFVGNTSTLVFTIDNSASTLAATGLNFTDNLPAGMVVAASPAASTTCTGGTLSATAGSSTISYNGGTVAALSGCTVQVNVTSSTPGLYVNTTGNLTSSLGNSGTASDLLNVNGIIYVDKDATGMANGLSWTDAFTDLQAALAIAQSGVEIWVAEGIYKPTTGTDRTISFVMKNGVAIYGGFPNMGIPTFADRNWAANPTILSGDLNDDDVISGSGSTLSITGNGENSYHVIFNNNNGLDGTAVLDGFTIKGGNANGGGENDKGGGMFNISSSPKLVNCTFASNSASAGGGGMANSASSSELTNCIFSGNVAEINGGGMANYYNPSPELNNCSFFGNMAESNGGGMANYLSSEPAVTNCTFSGNSATIGGGMSVLTSSSPLLTNCSFSGNAAIQGGGIFNDGYSPTLANCILWGNGIEVINFNNSSTTTVTHSIIQGGYSPCTSCPGGDGNVNPLFANAPNGDLHLLQCSPAIDAGTSTGAPTTDLDNNGRVDAINGGKVVDIGAYEFQSDLDGDDDGYANCPGADCNDNNAAIHPGATEICDGIDNDCDGQTDNIVTYFYDGFESGTYQPTWSDAGGTYTRTVTTTNPAVGGYAFSQTGFSQGHVQGSLATFSPSQPTAISYWVQPTTPSANHAYVVIGDENSPTNFGILFSFFSSANTLRFINSSFLEIPVSLNTWYHIEIKNIDWTAKNFDIYVNGDLKATDFAFRSTASDHVSNIYLYNYNANATALYDDIVIGVKPCCQDADSDGFQDIACGGNDCNDGNPDINPGATEVCDGIDNNCNMATDEGNVCCPAGNILYVNASATGANNGNSWTNAFTDLQSALNSTCPGITQIWVAAGTYKPTSGTDRNASFVMKNGVAIYGGFAGTETLLSQRNWTANVTTLNGDIDNDGTLANNSYHVIFNNNNGLTNTAVLDGFTISGGNANGSSANAYGGGMYNFNTSPAVNNCSFTGNSVTFSGSGMYNAGNSSPTVTNCSFSGNSANRGGGMFNDASSPAVANCSFSNNAASDGGGMYNETSSPTVTNCAFSGNTADFGGGMYNDESLPTVKNCTFYNNSAGSSTGGMFNGFANSVVTNSIFWANSGEILNIGSNPTVTYSIVQGGYSPCTSCPGGDGNVDPQFTSTTDLSLQPSSPAVDAGDDNANTTTLDLAGNPRKFDAIPGGSLIDLGAYEYQSIACMLAANCQPAHTAYVNGAGQAEVLATSLNNGSTGCGTLSFTINGQPSTSFGCADIGTPQTVTLTVTDDNGPATCTSTVTVQDTLRPNAMCKGIVKNLDGTGNATIAAADVDNGSNDNCTPVTFVNVSPNSFTCNTLGDQPVTLTVKDGYNNEKTCQATVTVQDNTPPTANCHATLQLPLDASGNATLTAAQVNNGSTDNCGIGTLVIDKTSFTCANAGPNTVELTVTDVNGKFSTCTSTVTVVDNTAPAAQCKSGLTFDLDPNGTVNLLPADIDNSSTDNCGITNRTLTPNSFDCSNVGSQQVILKVFDAANQMSSCTTSVAIVDAADPTATCQDITVNVDQNGNASITGSQVDNGSGDNCGIASLSVSPNSFDLSNLGQNNVVLTVTDNSNRTATCTAVVTVTNTNLPNAVCKAHTVQLNANGQGSITPEDVDGGSSAVGGIASLSVSPNSFACANVGPNTVTLTVIGNNNQQASCNATVTVQDNVVPNAQCKPATVQLDANGQGTLTASAVNNGSSDACGIASTSVSPSSFGCANVGTNTVTLTVTDVNNKTATCQATVTVQDNVSPSANCKPATVQLDANGQGTLAASAVNNGSSDACGIASLNVSPNSFGCANVGLNTVTLTVTDNNGKAATCQATVTVQDNVNPTPLCRDVLVQLDPQGNGSITAPQVDNNSFDNCGVASLSVSPNTFTLANVGINPVVLTVTDVNGKQATCTANVTVENNQLPNPVCVNINRNLDASGQVNLTWQDVDGGSTALGGIASRTVSPNLLTCSDLGQNTVVLTVVGNNNKQASCNAIVTVSDATPPTAQCKTATVQLSASGQGSLTAAQVNDGSFDNCGVASLSVLPNTFSCANVGATTVTLTVTDVNNLVSTCISTVNVVDNVAPVAVCKPHTVYLNASGNASMTAADIDGGSGDACGIGSLSASKTSFACNNLGANTVTLTVTDNNGKTASCQATVTVADTIAPMALCKPATVYLDVAGQMNLAVTQVDGGSFDNCSFTMSLSKTSFNCSEVGPNTVTLTATDASSNSHSCQATVNVVDNSPPTALCKPATVYLNANGQASVTTAQVNNGSSDNCGIASLSVLPNSFACANIGANTVTLTVNDVNGNSSNCSATVTAVDNLPPTLVCQNISIQLDGNANASITPAQVFNASASGDNCGSINLVSVSPSQFDCGEIGPNTVTLTANDGHGNTATCTATVTVLDFFTNVSVAVTPEDCGLGNGRIVVSVDAPGGQVGYSIDGGATWQFDGTFNGLAAGEYTVVVQAFGGLGCTNAPMPTTVPSIGMPQTWYKDMDADGYSDGLTLQSCTPPGVGWYLAAQLTATAGDCNDNDAEQHPGQVWYRDMDNDGHSNGQTLVQCSKPWGYKTVANCASLLDCNDDNAAIHPGATEVCNDLDDDCDGLVDEGLAELTYVGNVVFSNQAQVDAWSSCYTVIDGNLTIQNSGIDSLGSLRKLRMVTGSVTIKQTSLPDLRWLLELDTVGGGLAIQFNSKLGALDGLDSLKSVGGALGHHHNLLCDECCAIYELLNKPGGIGGGAGIFLNKQGCNSVAQVNAECAPGNNLVGPGSSCPDCGVAPAATVSMQLTPNPTNGRVNVVLDGLRTTDGMLVIHDPLGRVLLRQKVGNQERSLVLSLDLTGFVPGEYWVRMVDGRDVLTQKLVLMR
ncbi:MAG: MopE-related protein [Saprospiraceae bacterium]